MICVLFFYAIYWSFFFFTSLHLTLAVCEEAKCKSLGHISKVADAPGVNSSGTSQGAEEVIGQIAAAFLQGSPLCLCNNLRTERHTGEKQYFHSILY